MKIEVLNKLVKDNKSQLPVFSKKWKFHTYKPLVVEKYNRHYKAIIPNNIISHKIF